MKNILTLLAISLLLVGFATAQVKTTQTEEKKNSLTIGILQGGGALIGADFEFLVSDKIGLQIGGGLVAYGAGLNYHLKPSVGSSFLSLQYWHQGVNETHTQTLVGANYCYRGKKWFSCQIGFGFPLEKGVAWPDDIDHPSFMLTYAIGRYFTL